MVRNIRFIVYSGDEEFMAEIRATLLQMDGVKIVAEVDEAALLGQAAQQFPCDVMLVDLDPTPETVLPMIGEVTRANRDLAIFAMSESSDGQLILKTMRTGVREFIPKPIEDNTLKEAIDRVSINRTDTQVQGKFICVIGTSGGVGTSLITTNLGVELAALAERDVTLVDLDYRYGQLAILLDVDPRYTIADLCSSPEALEAQVIGRALMKHSSGVQVLSRPNHLAEAESITAAACAGVFSSLTLLNEYVISDGPIRFDASAKSVLALADITLLVVQQLVPCVRNAARIIEGLRENGFNLDRAKILCNRVGRSTAHLSVKDVTETLGLDLYATIPDDWETASGAMNLGEPLMTYGPKSKLRIAIQEIAERLHRPEPDADDKSGRKQGLIGRIFAGN